MSNSYYEIRKFTCPDTNREFEFQAWLIIDRSEHPQLIDQAINWQLHRIKSPYTGKLLHLLDAPLLIFQANHEPVLIYVSQDNVEKSTDRQTAYFLLKKLYNSLGETWDDKWLHNGLFSVERALLPAILSQDPEATLKNLELEFGVPFRQSSSHDENSKLTEQKQDSVPNIPFEFHGLTKTQESQLRTIIAQLMYPTELQTSEERLSLFENALQMLPQKGNETLWATLCGKMANLLSEVKGDRQVSAIEDAITYLRSALEVFSFDKYPDLWAGTHINLGATYMKRLQGNREQNIELAIQSYNSASQVFTKQTTPSDWALIQNNLGNAYRNRILGLRKENIEKAIAHYLSALDINTKLRNPEGWALTKTNLGTAYRNRIVGEIADNVEQAIEQYEGALQIFRSNRKSPNWAMTNLNLGVAYINRIIGNPAHNIERAIEHYEESVRVYNEIGDRILCARAQANLGDAYSNRINGEPSQNIAKAIAYYETAIQVFEEDQLLIEYATTITSLASSLRQNSLGDRNDNTERALDLLKSALLHVDRNNLPEFWALIQTHLAALFASEKRNYENISLAVKHYYLALEVLTFKDFPNRYIQILIAIGHLYFGSENWTKCVEIFAEIIELNNNRLLEAYSDGGQKYVIAEAKNVYSRMAYACLNLGHNLEALQWVEAGKARLMSISYSTSDGRLGMLQDTELHAIQNLRREIRNLELDYRTLTSESSQNIKRSIVTNLSKSRSEMNRLYLELTHKYPDLTTTTMQASEILTSISKDTILIIPIITAKGTKILVLPHGVNEINESHIISLPDFTQDVLNDLFLGSDSVYGWLNSYLDYKSQKLSLYDFSEGIENITVRLWDQFTHFIVDHIKKYEQKDLIFTTQGILGLLPIQASRYEVAGELKYLLDDYRISFIPSVNVLKTIEENNSRTHSKSASVAGISTYRNLPNLPNSVFEVESIAQIFNTDPLLNEKVTKSQLQHHLFDKDYIHLSCHGSFSWNNNTFNSALMLYDDEPLLLSEIIGRFKLENTRLITLSACETGIFDTINLPDEFISLASGMLQVGASAVISSMWSVAEFSTALLMEYFYSLHIEYGVSPTRALQQAQIWLREATRDEIVQYCSKFQNKNIESFDEIIIGLIESYKRDAKPFHLPFFWAAFTYSGK